MTHLTFAEPVRFVVCEVSGLRLELPLDGVDDRGDHASAAIFSW
jgi:hypothetical protein